MATLWAHGSNQLHYSTDQGVTWNEVDLSSLPDTSLSEPGGPTDVWKIYVGVEYSGVWRYDTGGWTQEYAYSDWFNNIYHSPRVGNVWASDDDSLVVAIVADNASIVARDGAQGTSWAIEYDDSSNYDQHPIHVHGNPTGTAVYAIFFDDVAYGQWLARRDPSTGVWTEVARINDGTGGYDTVQWNDVTVISDTEVWICGDSTESGVEKVHFWKWNGTTLSDEFSHTASSAILDGLFGMWISRDGSEGWAVSEDTDHADLIHYYRYNGSVWSHYSSFDGYAFPVDITQRDGIPTSAISIHGSRGEHNFYTGSAWQSDVDFDYPPAEDWRTVWDTGTDDAWSIQYIEVDPPAADTTAPYLDGRDPSLGETGVDHETSITLEIKDDGNGVDPASIILTVDGSVAWTGEAAQTGFGVVKTAITGGLRYIISPDDSFDYEQIVEIEVNADDLAAVPNSLNESYSFTTEALVTYPHLGQEVNVPRIDIIGFPTPVQEWNQFDEHGLTLGLPRLRAEKNWEYRRRLHDTFANLANSSYRGLVNGITRELGLTLFDALTINPVTSADGSFVAPDPYVLFDGAWLLLYSNYANNELAWAIDRFEPGDNYEHLGRLVDMINTTELFEAGLRPGVDPFTKSMTVLNQSNRMQQRTEFIPQSTKFNLGHSHVVSGTVFFSDRTRFRTEVNSVSEVETRGQYHIDYQHGVVTCRMMPNVNDYVRYEYVEYPFIAKASPIILMDINSDNFKVKMFNQILQTDNSSVHGLPTELGVDIINELMSVVPMYWGI